MLSKEQLEEKKRKILLICKEFLDKNGNISNEELSNKTNISKSSVQRYLNDPLIIELLGQKTYDIIQKKLTKNKDYAPYKGGYISSKITEVSKDKYGAKLATLTYDVLEEKDNLTLVKINLETGRHHQIRVQFANIEHSLYGDQKYGKGPKNTQIALWAYKLEFKHPTKDEIISFECKPKKIGIWEKFDI